MITIISGITVLAVRSGLFSTDGHRPLTNSAGSAVLCTPSFLNENGILKDIHII